MTRAICLCMVVMVCLSSAFAQQSTTVSAATPVNATVPMLVNFSGTLTDTNGKPVSGIVGVTFYLYKDQQGGSPLWMETQNVQPAKTGYYSVMLGSTSSQGLPADLFVSGEARWLGVQAQGQVEQARVMLLSVPYALKAGDAQTVGGLPPSAFVLAAPSTSPNGQAEQASASRPLPGSAPPPAGVTGSGTTDFVPLWTGTSTIGNSVLFQSGTGSTAKIGINTTAPLATLHVKGPTIIAGLLSLPPTVAATAAQGAISQPLNMAASAFNSSTHAPVNQTFQWEAEPIGNNTASPSATLNLRFGSGTTKPFETGLKVASNGRITFAAGQTFPSTGTVTSVGSGLGLTGGPITTNGSLSINTTVVPQLGAASNTFAGGITASSFSGNGAGLSNVTAVNSNELGGLNSSAYAQLGVANTFTQSQTISNQFSSGGVALTAIGGEQSVSNGADAIRATGGAADPNPKAFAIGGNGVSAYGGDSGFQGGNGVYGQGGAGPAGADGSGGVFQGGGNGFGDGIDAYPTGGGAAGYFAGNIQVTGSISAGTKDFKVDHPLDPANKYLVHASVESSEMMNIYTGNITTDSQGSATVQLPEWFEVLNADFRYQLTVIGQFAQAIVARKIENNRFEIRTSVPSVEVSWQVTGVRQDAFAKANPLVVEEEKDARLRGFYIHPELYGAPPEKQIEWARHPQTMKRMQEIRAKQQATNRAAPQAATAQYK